MLNKTFKKLEKVADEELEMANKNNPPLFNSPHEGYAVILEEVEEAEADLIYSKLKLKNAWGEIKMDDNPKHCIEELCNYALYGASELIQVAAMCKKFTYSAKNWEEE